ncbi:MAG: right-handed parallel beta-helix repeat-containing protein [Proteobacteria bacterium]|nr:right-handed parallel beta-helix repeat-containing protein [Pseudomonadota bacterium]MBU1739037.1 right-handed parallel beta-helix repeat-containing protein [Pseudomonadota bacterium]
MILIFKRFAIPFLFQALFFAVPVQGEVLSVDTSWQGVVELREDVVVPPGITLRVAPGTIIRVHPSEGTRIDPEYLSHQTEILVRGSLQAEGTADRRIRFTNTDETKVDRWAGLIVDDGGKVSLKNCILENGEAGLTVMDGEADISDSGITNNRYGIVAYGPKSTLKIGSSRIKNNEYGLSLFDSPGLFLASGVEFKDNSKQDRFSGNASAVAFAGRSYEAGDIPVTAVYRDEALTSYTEWRGRVRVEGQLRLPPDSRLIIMPGTVVEFTKRDTNNDGIGENGIQIQGMIVAKGTPDQPIIFRSGEKVRRMGDWDSINILGGDQAQNILEYCRIEDAYRAVHFHFSNVAVHNSVLKNNYRGAQFQESVVSIIGTQFYGNKSGIQARDSDLIFRDNEIIGNMNGANFFRLNLQASGNVFANNSWDGLRVREGTSLVTGNLSAGNRVGLIIADTVYGEFSANVVSGNLESGFLVRNSDNLILRSNAVIRNGVNGISVRDTRAEISENLIADNTERGVGITSFTGTIARNNIVDNGIYAIGLEGGDRISAEGNWWGNSDLDKEIFDVHDDPALGEVVYEPRLEKPVTFKWPLNEVRVDTSFSGIVHIDRMMTVAKDRVLSVKPGSTLVFTDDEAGILVDGGIFKAVGTPGKRILFTSQTKDGPSDWLGIRLERATGSSIENCDFEYAEWGLHVHFVAIDITGCSFTNNDIGIKFRSGPVNLSRSKFIHNRIGIRSFLGRMNLFENEIVENEIGIFVREGGSGMKIYHNNIHKNERYDMRMGDFNKEDVQAGSNWWGGENPLDRIFDGRQEPGIGKVVFEPVLDHPLDLPGL